MKKILFIALLFIPVCLFAQVDYLEEKNLINSIKKDAAYIYGEGIAGSEKDALSIARDELSQKIHAYSKEYLSPAKADYLDSKLLLGSSCKIQLKRGLNDRVFLYLEKDNIREKPAPCKSRSGKSPQSHQPVQEVNEEVVEVVEVAKVREEALVAEDEYYDIMEIFADDLKEDPVVEEFETAEMMNASMLSRILSMEDTRSLVNLLNAGKKERKVMWGEVKGEINPTWYVIVISGEKVEAILDKGDSLRKDFRSSELRNLRDFGGKKKLWFIIYE